MQNLEPVTSNVDELEPFFIFQWFGLCLSDLWTLSEGDKAPWYFLWTFPLLTSLIILMVCLTKISARFYVSTLVYFVFEKSNLFIILVKFSIIFRQTTSKLINFSLVLLFGTMLIYELHIMVMIKRLPAQSWPILTYFKRWTSIFLLVHCEFV